MTVEETRFISEIFKAIRSDVAGVADRVLSVELRQSGVEQQLLGVNTHLVALQHGLDSLSGDMWRANKRLELVDDITDAS